MQVQSMGGKILWRRKWQPTPVSLPGKLHGQRSPAVYSPWSCKDSVATELLSMRTCTHHHAEILSQV